MSNTDDELKPKDFAPEIRTLAYAMETMSHLERCIAIAKLADEQHNIGLKNGRFGYIHESQVEQEKLKAQIKELAHWSDFFEDSSMNALTPSERLSKRIKQLQSQLNSNSQDKPITAEGLDSAFNKYLDNSQGEGDE